MASWLTFGPYGDVLLGSEENPRYSTTSWIAMMFTASMGAGLLPGALPNLFFTSRHRRSARAPAATWPTICPYVPYLSLGDRALGDLLSPAIPIAYMLFVDNKKA